MPVVGFKNSPPKSPKRYSSDPKTRAAELVAEGKLGGARPGAGRPRKSVTEAQPKRASTAVTEWAQQNPELIASVIPDVLNDPDASDHLKLRAVKLGLRVESDEVERQRQDEREGRSPAELPDPNADHSELVALLAAKFAANPLLARRLGAVLSAVDVPATDPPKLA
jgi:hypothetical protein